MSAVLVAPVSTSCSSPTAIRCRCPKPWAPILPTAFSPIWTFLLNGKSPAPLKSWRKTAPNSNILTIIEYNKINQYKQTDTSDFLELIRLAVDGLCFSEITALNFSDKTKILERLIAFTYPMDKK